MRPTIFAVSAVLVMIGAGASAAAECAISDSAMCLADPNCHWDGEKRGCYPGPLSKRDVCVVHEAKALCDTSSLGCKWSDATNKCESKGE